MPACFAELPVGAFGWKSKFGGAPQRRTSLLSSAEWSDGNGRSAGYSGTVSRNCWSFSVEFGDAHVVAFGLFEYFFHAREDGGGVLLIFFQRGDFFVGLVAFGLHGLGGLDEAAALGIDFGERLEIERDAAVARHLLDHVGRSLMYPRSSIGLAEYRKVRGCARARCASCLRGALLGEQRLELLEVGGVGVGTA